MNDVSRQIRQPIYKMNKIVNFAERNLNVNLSN